MTVLQTRYRAAPANEQPDDPLYVLLECLTDEDIDFNVARLRRVAAAKMKHADALEAYKNDPARLTDAEIDQVWQEPSEDYIKLPDGRLIAKQFFEAWRRNNPELAAVMDEKVEGRAGNIP